MRLSAQARAELRRRRVALGDVFAVRATTAQLKLLAANDELSPVSWLNAPVYDALGGGKPELATNMVFQAPSNYPQEWAAAYDAVLAD